MGNEMKIKNTDNRNRNRWNLSNSKYVRETVLLRRAIRGLPEAHQKFFKHVNAMERKSM